MKTLPEWIYTPKILRFLSFDNLKSGKAHGWSLRGRPAEAGRRGNLFLCLGFTFQISHFNDAMVLRKGDMVELIIDRVAYGGQGVARLNGLVLFVRGAIPGDKIKAQVVKKKKGLCRGETDRTAGAIPR